MTRTWGLFAVVREKRLEKSVIVPWHPRDLPMWRFDVPGLDLSTYKGGGWVPDPHEPGVLVQYRDGGFH
jgi:hypothetical protein